MHIQRPLLLALIPALMFAAVAGAEDENLTDLDLATLMGMDVTVTSAAKRAQAISDAAAAVFVITRDDIRRSGATSLPEVLRMAPGLQVARINTRSWAVTARGLNSRFANKLLVMIDGRSIYTSTFSGVMWEAQPVFLHNIERIEVVRGPGGALWGINAVNGVINIITRKAVDDSGLSVSAGVGSDENSAGAVQFGGDLAGIASYRAYIDHSDVDGLATNDSRWRQTLAGWRLDRETTNGLLTFQGDVSDGDFGRAKRESGLGMPTRSQSGSVAASWTQALAPGELDLRAYYRWTDRSAPVDWEERGVAFETQFSASRIGRHLLSVGAGVRRDTDRLHGGQSSIALTTPALTQTKWSVYGQDEAHFFADSVRLIIGGKLENLDSNGVAFQPTIRSLWRLNEAHTLWAAASRAVRTPSRLERHARIDLGSGDLLENFWIRINGDDDLSAEDLHAYEFGWRFRPGKSIAFDLAVYRNDHARLIALRSDPPLFEPGMPPRIVLPLVYANSVETRMKGLELSAEWAALPWLRIEAHGVWHDAGASSMDIAPGATFGAADPKRSFLLQTRMDLPRDVELDIAWRAVSEVQRFYIDRYDALNARIGWTPVANIELSLAIDNLLNQKHVEFYDEMAIETGVAFGRTVTARFTWRPAR